MTHTNEDLLALADRLDAPAYWFSGSGEGHEGENTAPREAAAALRAIVAERQKTRAVMVKPLVWRDFANVSCAPDENYGDNLAVALCSYFDGHLECPEDGEDGSELDEFDCWKVWVSDSTVSVLRRIAQVANAHILAALDVSETPESERQTDLLSESERQAIRDKALDDAAQCCEAEADKCDDAVKWGGASNT